MDCNIQKALDNLKSEVRENSNLIKELRNEREEDKARITELTEQLRDTSEQFDNFRTQYDLSTGVSTDTVPGNIPNTLSGPPITGQRQHGSTLTDAPARANWQEAEAASDIVDTDIDADNTVENTSDKEGETPAGKPPQPSTNQTSKRPSVDVSPVQERIAFSAYMSDMATGLGHHQTIPFDAVLSNVGDAFHPIMHMFVCPVDGLYFFHCSVISERHEHVETELVKDMKTLVRMYASGVTGDSAHGHDQGSNSVVVACKKGEHVWVRQHLGSIVGAWEFSTFSGFLIFNL